MLDESDFHHQGFTSYDDLPGVRHHFPRTYLNYAQQTVGDWMVLYAQLYGWSGGPTEDDHCWHEFDRFDRIEEFPFGVPYFGEAAMFAQRICAVADWV